MKPIIKYNKESKLFIAQIHEDEKEDFEVYSTFFLEYHIYWNKDNYGFGIAMNRIEEMIQWFEYHSIEYTLSNDSSNKLLDIANSYKQDMIFTRSRKINKDLFTDEYREFSFHKDAFAWREKRSSYLDSYDPGLGKTSMTIFQFSTLFNNNEIDGVIIVVPIGMPYHWKVEILKFVNIFVEDDILIIDNKNKQQPLANNKDKKIIIVPENLYKDIILSYKKGHVKGKSTKKLHWTKYMDFKKEWDKKSLCFVADESHLYRNPDSIRTKAILSTKDDFNFRYLLSATPSINRIENIYSQLNFIDSSIIPMSFNAFRIWLAEEIGDRFNMYNIKKYNIEKVATVKEAYSSVVTQLLQTDIPELKAKQMVSTINVDFSKKQKAIYDLVIQEELKILEDEYNKITWKLVLNRFSFLIQIIDNPLLLLKHTFEDDRINRLVASWNPEKDDNKFIALKSRLSNLIEDQGKRIIVYDIHPLTLDMFKEKFKAYNPLLIHGGIKHKNKDLERQEIIDQFNNNDKHKLILLSSLTSSAGINLQKGSDHIIVTNEPNDSTLMRQLMGRTHRVNSTRDSYVESIINNKSIDNIRFLRNRNRIVYNNTLDQEVSPKDLSKLLNGEA